MGCRRYCLYIIAALVVLVAYCYHSITKIPEVPKIDVDKWWGPGESKKMDQSIRPFKIEFKEDMISDLKSRLSKTKLTRPLEGVGFEYGFNNDYLKEVIDFWGKSYNFKERENFLNKYPSFKTNIQGMDLHFLHIKPKVTKDVEVLPLLLVSGVPQTVRDYYELIPLLTTPRKDHDFVFEVVVASLPGFGFSQGPSKVGLGADGMAVVLRNLMHRLGHKKYYVQSGNWGAAIFPIMCLFFPDEVLGHHNNAPFIMTEMANIKWLLGSIFPSLVVEQQYYDWLYPISKVFEFMMEEMGYLHMHATKPDTIGVALGDSPAGLAAYMLEKYSTWTNRNLRKLRDGGLTKYFNLTDLLDHVMIYWVSESYTTAIRIYAESLSKRYLAFDLDKIPIYVPTALACFEHELLYQPTSILKDKMKNIVHVAHYKDAGHFVHFEKPQLIADDMWIGFSKIRQYIRAHNTKEL